MKVLILSKTHVGSSACVGGVVLETNEFVRLMNGPNQYQEGNTPLNIGQVWDIDYEARPDREPHIEDVHMKSKKYLHDFKNFQGYILGNLPIWEGKPEILFDGKLNWTGKGSGYLGNPENLPLNSVGFWISDRDLVLEDDRYYIYKRKRVWRNRKFSYVGFPNRIAAIPAGTLIRVSLAKWWKPDDINIEHRCYLQISGWY